MIGFIEGSVRLKTDSSIVVIAGGVGYVVNCTSEVIEGVEIGSEVELFIETKMTESDITLFGFEGLEEQLLFRKLCTVQGVGGKVGMAVLSFGYDRFCQAVLNEDKKAIQSISGIGPKSAARILTDMLAYVEKSYDGHQADGVALYLETGRQNIIKAGLKSLGFTGAQADNALQQAVEELSAAASNEQLVAASLKRLAPAA